jgi:hypothetical protein
MDRHALKLALERIKLPCTFISLISNLFGYRHNTVITAHGTSAPYRTLIGIDQGEVLSPLLWVIYLDPLLTMLKSINNSPYVFNANESVPPVQVSALAFMDDTTLIATNKEGLIFSLDIVQEFSSFNNTKINFDKALLICNRNPDD